MPTTRQPISCPLCGATSGHDLRERLTAYDGVQYTFFACRHCGLEFADPLAPAGAEHYEDAEFYGMRWEFFEALKLAGRRNGSILEIGCGAGYFLDHARKTGFTVTGLDFNRNAIAFAQERFGLDDVHACTMADYREGHPGKTFDIICFFHVIEHLPAPLEFLREVASLLAPGGLVILSTPHPHRIFVKRLVREPWDYPPHHITRWNEHSMRWLMDAAGFTVQAIEGEPPVSQTVMTLVAQKLASFSKPARKGIPGPRSIAGQDAAPGIAGKLAGAIGGIIAGDPFQAMLLCAKKNT